MNSYGARNLEEAMLMEVKSYLKCEMKVRVRDIEKLDIVRIFPPAKEDWNTLYVEFGSEYEVNLIFKHTRVMVKEDHNVVRWIPKELFERFQALDLISYNMREEMKKKDIKLRTKVSVGKDDLEFCIKMPNGRWKYQVLPNGLPRIDLEARRRTSLTSSPPPGRPDIGVDDRKRQYSGSDVDESVKKSKTAVDGEQYKQGDMLRNKEGRQIGDKEFGQVRDMEAGQVRDMEVGQVSDMEVGHVQSSRAQAAEKEDNSQSEALVRKHLDLGSFTNQEGYCPSTPAKTKLIQDLPVINNSPVFHSKSREIQA